MSNVNYIKQSSIKTKKKLKEYSLFAGSIPVVFKERFKNEIDIKQILKKIEKRIPKNLFQNLDIIYVGDFPELNSREVESVFMDGGIYLSNNQYDDLSVYSSIVHELAHCIEKTFEQEVYGDEQIISEFLLKRKQLQGILEASSLFCKPKLYLKLDHDEEFDNFLYKTVGYDKLALLSSNIFLSPYAATDIREYFSNGFEYYFCNGGDPFFKKACPKLYNKIIYLTKM